MKKFTELERNLITDVAAILKRNRISKGSLEETRTLIS